MNAISSEAKMHCDCCWKLKMCKMYILQNGESAWICKECREGKKDKMTDYKHNGVYVYDATSQTFHEQASKPESEMIIQFEYLNHRGVKSLRTVKPIHFYFGSTEWHPEKQWLLHAYDCVKKEARTFAWTDMMQVNPNGFSLIPIYDPVEVKLDTIR